MAFISFFIIYSSLYYPSSLGPTEGPRESARRYSKPLCGFVGLARPPADQRLYKGRNWIFLILAGLRCLHAPCNQLSSVFLWPVRLNSIFLSDKTNSILLVVLSRYETTSARHSSPLSHRPEPLTRRQAFLRRLNRDRGSKHPGRLYLHGIQYGPLPRRPDKKAPTPSFVPDAPSPTWPCHLLSC